MKQTVLPDDPHTLGLKAVVADIEPDALIRILQIFRDRNVNPQKVSAQRIILRSQSHEVLHVEVEFTIADLTMDTLRFIAVNIAQMPTTLSTVFGHPGESRNPTNQSRRPDNV